MKNYLLVLSWFFAISLSYGQLNRPIILETDEGLIESKILVHPKKIITIDKAFYHWFDNDQIYQTQSDYSGRLLHGQYTSYYPDGQLKMQGLFHFGLKIGYWKEWHPNGTLKELKRWKKGLEQGAFKQYSTRGEASQQGRYRKGIMKPKKKKAEKKEKPEKEKQRSEKTKVKKEK